MVLDLLQIIQEGLCIETVIAALVCGFRVPHHRSEHLGEHQPQSLKVLLFLEAFKVDFLHYVLTLYRLIRALYIWSCHIVTSLFFGDYCFSDYNIRPHGGFAALDSELQPFNLGKIERLEYIIPKIDIRKISPR